MMNTIFRDEVSQGWLSVYMDDLAIQTRPEQRETEETHWQWHRNYVHHILDKLEEHDLYLKPEKCKFELEQMEYLGIVVGHNMLQMDKKKTDQVKGWNPPRNPTEVWKFLGFTGYYPYFIKDYSKLA
jgi:Reverse transcriptase (RNA-dependent DNA polymerase)